MASAREHQDMAKVYVLEHTDRVKVGSSRFPGHRKREIGYGTFAYVTDLLPRGRRVERIAHDLLKAKGLCIENEWFDAPADDAIEIVKQAESIVAGQSVPPYTTSQRMRRSTFSTTIDAETRFRLKVYIKEDPANRVASAIIEAALREYLDKVGAMPFEEILQASTMHPWAQDYIAERDISRIQQDATSGQDG